MLKGLTIRLGNKEDFPFILDSWLKSYYGNKIKFPRMPYDTYLDLHRPLASAILDRSHIHMAINDEDPTLIYGYCIFEKTKFGDVIHYVYVKRKFNGFGISSILLRSMEINLENCYVTHMTCKGRDMFSKYNFNYCFYFLYPLEK